MNMKRDEPYLVPYVSRLDIDIVINRIPIEYRKRLKEITTWHRSDGLRMLGYVTRRGRRDINLCTMLPPRVSLGRYLKNNNTAKEFGAPNRGQWPPWAVRRYLLYSTLLHELGHLQIAKPKSRNVDRKFASETLAQEFADEWRNRLYSKRFEHPDPIHNFPDDEELRWIPVWVNLNKKQRFELVNLVIKAPYGEFPDISGLGKIPDNGIEILKKSLCQNHSNCKKS